MSGDEVQAFAGSGIRSLGALGGFGWFGFFWIRGLSASGLEGAGSTVHQRAGGF